MGWQLDDGGDVVSEMRAFVCLEHCTHLTFPQRVHLEDGVWGGGKKGSFSTSLEGTKGPLGQSISQLTAEGFTSAHQMLGLGGLLCGLRNLPAYYRSTMFRNVSKKPATGSSTGN